MSLFPLLIKFADDSIAGELDFIRLCPEYSEKTELKSYLDKYNLVIAGLETDRHTKEIDENVLHQSNKNSKIGDDGKQGQKLDENKLISRRFARKYTKVDLNDVISTNYPLALTITKI